MNLRYYRFRLSAELVPSQPILHVKPERRNPPAGCKFKCDCKTIFRVHPDSLKILRELVESQRKGKKHKPLPAGADCVCKCHGEIVENQPPVA